MMSRDWGIACRETVHKKVLAESFWGSLRNKAIVGDKILEEPNHLLLDKSKGVPTSF